MSCLADGDSTEINFVLSWLTYHLFLTGDIIIRQGDLPDAFYIIQWGSLEVKLTYEKKMTIDNQKERKINTKIVNKLVAGSIFGEVGLLTKMNWTASVIAKSDSLIAKITKDNFNAICEWFPHVKWMIWNNIWNYSDHEFEFWRRYVSLIPYLWNMKSEIIDEVLCIL